MTGTARQRWLTVTIGLATALAMGAGGSASGAPHSAPAVSGTTSSGFAGYQVSKPSTHVKSASEDFVVPTITCKKNFSGVGPSVLVSSTVNKKTNTFSVTGAGVGVACEHKKPVYQSIIEVNSTSFNDFFLSAGDDATITVKTGRSRTTVTLTDVTTHTTKTRHGKRVTGAIANLGGAALSINKAGVGLDPFGKIHITNATVNGKSLKAEKAVRVTWTHKKDVLVTASKLSKGKDFALTFKKSE